MALQDGRVVMVGLSSLGDQPADAVQPPLVDGVHLRWAFEQSLGFPWYGFHLFRRPHDAGIVTWSGDALAGIQPGPSTSTTLTTPHGTFRSDVPLVFTDDFAPAGRAEIDLAGRAFVRFELPPGEQARRFDVKVGCRQRVGESTPTRDEVSFAGFTPGSGPNPRVVNGATFLALHKDGRQLSRTNVRSHKVAGTSVAGLDCEWGIDISLPQWSTYVELNLVLPGFGYSAQTQHDVTLQAFEEDGTAHDVVRVRPGNVPREELVTLVGTRITRVAVRAHQDTTLLRGIAYGRGSATEIDVTAYAGTTPVQELRLSGYAGQLLTATIEMDGMTALRLGPGSAALVDLGVVSVSQNATLGWQQLPSFPSPMRLPITHPDYPCTAGMPENLEQVRTLASSRIRYGAAANTFPSPVAVPAAGTVRVTAGSRIVLGNATAWMLDIADTVFRVGSDATAYSIAMVVGPDKLVLNRPYAGATNAAASYALSRDAFAQLHDQLAMLVQGGPAAGSMASRVAPPPVHVQGTITVVGPTGDVPGSAAVVGAGTGWTSDLVGLTFQVTGEGRSYRVVSVESATQLTLDRPYAGASGTGKAYAIVARPISADGEPVFPSYSPLDMVLLPTVYPARAQALGLYWIDETATAGESYDYLIVPSTAAAGGLDAAAVLARIQLDGFATVDGFIVYDRRYTATAALAAPTDVRTHALPGATRIAPNGTSEDATTNVGVTWPIELAPNGTLLPGRPVYYHVWRASLGEAAKPQRDATFELLTGTSPVFVAPPDPAVTQRASDWPPFPMQYVDQAVAEGWWGYRVTAVDLFGRHSAASGDAAWWQWTPEPKPAPWYYVEPEADRVVDPAAIRLVCELKPPAPAAIEAYALDPADPFVVKDAAYTAWWTALIAKPWYQALSAEEKQDLIGLRVRFVWTERHMQQAPRAKEFRIYWQPGLRNTLMGRVQSVLPMGPESEVQTDIAEAVAPGALAGAAVRVGGDTFTVLGNVQGPETAGALRLRVRNIGPTREITPQPFGTCAIAIPRAYAIGTIGLVSGSREVLGMGTDWTAALEGMELAIQGEVGFYTVATVESATKLWLDRPYEGETEGRKGYGIRHPLWSDPSVPAEWDRRFHVVPYDDPHVVVGTDPSGRPYRAYDVFLPDPESRLHGGLPLAPALANPIAYGEVGVSTADDRTYPPDDPRWSSGDWGDRPGNEGRTGSAVTVARILRDKPERPVLLPVAEPAWASTPDDDGQSTFSFRWRATPDLQLLALRALDETIFHVDWTHRPRPAGQLDDLALFPEPNNEPTWTAARRAAVTTALNALDTLAADPATTEPGAMATYRALSNDAVRILAGLPGNERAFTQLNAVPLDASDPSVQDRVGPDDPEGYVPDPTLRVYGDRLDANSPGRYLFRAAHVDGAQNRSDLSLATPVVRVPDALAPHVPVIQSVTCTDGVVTIGFTQPDWDRVTYYRVYRAADEAAASSVASMPTRFEPSAELLSRAGDVVSFEDALVADGALYWYRVAAVRQPPGPVVRDLESAPSSVVRVKGFRAEPPSTPTVNAALNAADGTVTLTWTADTGTRSDIERSWSGTTWTTVAALPDGVTQWVDDVSSSGTALVRYRIRSVAPSGKTSYPGYVEVPLA